MDKSRSAEELILICGNDMSALEQLYILYKKDVFSYAYSLLCDYSLAEDALHEVFIRLNKSALRFKHKSTVKTFILGITKNTAKEFLRKQKKFIIQSANDLNETTDSLDFTQNIHLNTMLDLLNEKQRETVTLHIYIGLTFAEISKQLRTPVSTIKSRYQKAIELLRKQIGDENL